jgi:alpha-L-rhamnosidase
MSEKNKPFQGARWIGSPFRGGPRTCPPAYYFRRSFLLDQPIASAELKITSLGLYEAECNGTEVGNEVFSPGWTDYSKRVQYRSYDILPLLKKGENALGVVLGEGWYSGTIGWNAERQHYGESPLLLVRLEIRFRDGTATEIVSDQTWKTTTGPILENDFLMGESYDARLELGAWTQAGYSDATWQSIRIALDPKIKLDLAAEPAVRRLGELHPSGSPFLSVRNGRQIRLYDLGQNFTGRARIAVRSKSGTTLSLRFGEILNPDGSLYVDNLRCARATDYYTCKGSDLETWEPRFTFHGFRYVEISGLVESDHFEIVGVVLHSDMRVTGSFSCSNPLLNQLQSNIVWGQKSNFLEVPTDCPQRDERLGWTGDAQVFIRTAAFNMDIRGFFHKWMRDLRDAQINDGGIPAVVPRLIVDDSDGGPAWSDAMIICPWTVYICYEDKKILEDNYEAMVRYISSLGHHSLGHIRSHPDLNKWGGFGDWLALDGGGKTEGITSKDLIGTAFYAYDVALMMRISALLGKAKDVQRFQRLHRKIVTAFQRRFVTYEGLIVSGTQTAYVLALQFDLLPERLRDRAAAYLALDIKNRDFHLATGFVGTPYILEVLEKYGHLEVAYRLLEQEKFPSWLFPVKNGATTIWERWDGWTPEKGPQDKAMNSYNHYAYGAVGAWIYQTVAGLDLDLQEPGYKHIIFKPRPGGSLTWAEAELKISSGKARIRWEKTPKGLSLDLHVPSGSRATLIPPPEYGGLRKLKSGRHQISLHSRRA